MAEVADQDNVSSLDKVGDYLQRMTMEAIRNGVGPITGASAYADDRLERVQDSRIGRETSPSMNDGSAAGGNAATASDRDAAIRMVIRESVVAAGTQGFVTGLGGFVAMPVMLPANLAGSLIINARMVGAIAHLRGYDLEDPHTQAVMMLTVAGSSVQATSSAVGVKVGASFAKQAIAAVPIAVIRQINKRAGVFLIAKYGTKRSVLTLSNAVPGVGGLVGGTVDAALTRAIGRTALTLFSEG
ncbi:MAG: EcsC family protein [Rubrobacteraceae bacterium]